MGFRTLGRVVEKWTAVPVLAFEAWGYPVPVEGEDTLRHYLRVMVLHPQTEQTSQCTVTCDTEAQWTRYPIGSWLVLWVQGWQPLPQLLRSITIVE